MAILNMQSRISRVARRRTRYRPLNCLKCNNLILSTENRLVTYAIVNDKIRDECICNRCFQRGLEFEEESESGTYTYTSNPTEPTNPRDALPAYADLFSSGVPRSASCTVPPPTPSSPVSRLGVLDAISDSRSPSSLGMSDAIGARSDSSSCPSVESLSVGVSFRTIRRYRRMDNLWADQHRQDALREEVPFSSSSEPVAPIRAK